MMDNLRCYLAAPLFSEAERSFNEGLAQQLERYVSVYLPQRDGLLLRDLRAEGGDSRQGRHLIFEGDIVAIGASSVVVAVLDGPSVDDGVSFELGYATGLGIMCVGLASDSRRADGYFRNPMWECALSETFTSTAQLVRWASTFSSSRLRPSDTRRSGADATRPWLFGVGRSRRLADSGRGEPRDLSRRAR